MDTPHKTSSKGGWIREALFGAKPSGETAIYIDDKVMVVDPFAQKQALHIPKAHSHKSTLGGNMLDSDSSQCTPKCDQCTSHCDAGIDRLWSKLVFRGFVLAGNGTCRESAAESPTSLADHANAPTVQINSSTDDTICSKTYVHSRRNSLVSDDKSSLPKIKANSTSEQNKQIDESLARKGWRERMSNLGKSTTAVLSYLSDSTKSTSSDSSKVAGEETTCFAKECQGSELTQGMENLSEKQSYFSKFGLSRVAHNADNANEGVSTQVEFAVAVKPRVLLNSDDFLDFILQRPSNNRVFNSRVRPTFQRRMSSETSGNLIRYGRSFTTINAEADKIEVSRSASMIEEGSFKEHRYKQNAGGTARSLKRSVSSKGSIRADKLMILNRVTSKNPSTNHQNSCQGPASRSQRLVDEKPESKNICSEILVRNGECFLRQNENYGKIPAKQIKRQNVRDIQHQQSENGRSSERTPYHSAPPNCRDPRNTKFKSSICPSVPLSQDLPPSVFIGTSAGALASVIGCCTKSVSQACRLAIVIAMRKQVWEKPYFLAGVLHNIAAEWLDAVIPQDVDIEALQHTLLVVAYRVSKMRLEGFCRFDSRRDLIECTLASMHIPFYANGKAAVKARGLSYLDGSFGSDLIKTFVEGMSLEKVVLIRCSESDTPVGRRACLRKLPPNQMLDLLKDGFRFAGSLHRAKQLGALEKFEIFPPGFHSVEKDPHLDPTRLLDSTLD